MAAEDVMFNSLLLLGFDCESMEKKHRIPFNKEMFSHRQGNLKGMEVVIYFLLHRLNPEETERTFRTCWPALEALQHREFKQLAYTVLQQMEKDGILPSNTLPGKSVLDTAFGERFYNLLFHLSTFVLREILKQEFPAAKIPNLQRNLSQSVSVGKEQLKASLKAAKVHYCREMDKFKKFSQLVVSAQSRWRQFADDLTHRYRQLSHKLHKCVQEQEQFYSTVDKSIFTNMAALDRHAQLSAVRKMWKLLREEYQSTSTAAHGEGIVNDILHRGAPRHRLDIDTLLSHIHDSKQRANELSVYSNTTLDINTLTDRWHETLRTVHNGFLAESSRSDRVSSMHNLLSNVQSACGSHSAQLATLRNMNAQIKELLPQLEASVAVLESSLSEKKVASSSSSSLSALTPFTHKIRSAASSLRTHFSSATPSVVPTAGLKSYNLTLVPPTPVGPNTALGGALSMTPFTTVKGRNNKAHTNTTVNNRYEKSSSHTLHGVSASLPSEALNRIQESIRRAVHDPVRHSVTVPLSPVEQDIKRRIEFNVDSGEKERTSVRQTQQSLLQSPEEKDESPKWISASPINAHDVAVDKFVDQFLDPAVDHSKRYSDENLYDPTFEDDDDSYRYSADQVDTTDEPTSSALHSPHVRFAETVTNGVKDTNVDRSGHDRISHDLEDIDPQFDAHRHEFYKDEAAGFGRKRELLRTPSRPPLLSAHTTTDVDEHTATGTPTRPLQSQQTILHKTPTNEAVYTSSFSLSVSPLVSVMSPGPPHSTPIMSASPLLSTISSSPLFTIEGHTSRSSKVKMQNYMEDVT